MPTGMNPFHEEDCWNNVSILVLLDDAYRHLWFPLLFFLTRVSILVLLDDAYRLENIAVKLDGRDSVSILVLLDDAYRRRYGIWSVSLV